MPSRRASAAPRARRAGSLLGLAVVGAVASGLVVVGCLAASNDPPERTPINPPVRMVPNDMTGDVPGPMTPDYDAVTRLFDRYCTECHAGSAAPEGLDLSFERAHGNLVGRSSRQVTDRLRVAPGDPDASYLVDKVRGGEQCKTCPGDGCAEDAICGSQMPALGGPLSDDEIGVIVGWIEAGAPGPVGDGGPADMAGDAPPDDMTGDLGGDGGADLGADAPDAAPADMTAG